MTTNKSGKIRIYLYVLLTIAGCVFACSSIIPNDYIKLVVVMGTLCVGLYGIMKGLSSTGTSSEEELLPLGAVGFQSRPSGIGTGTSSEEEVLEKE